MIAVMTPNRIEKYKSPFLAQSGCIVLVAAAIFVGSLVAKGSGMVKTAGILAK